MPMNVQSIPSLSDKINQIRLLTAEIVNKEILPNENRLWHARRDGKVSKILVEPGDSLNVDAVILEFA